MKKAIIIMSVFALFLVGCGNSDKETESTTTHKTTASETASAYKDPQLVKEMQQAYTGGDYAKADEIADKIGVLYPDTIDSVMADNYKKLIEEAMTGQAENAPNDTSDYRSYIQLLSVTTSEPNSAGGIDLYIKWKNTSEKTVKYAYFTCDLYNAVDDKVENDISGRYSFVGKVTGPIDPGAVYGNNTHWGNAWYNHSGKYAKITEIELEYMDGTDITIPQEKINDLFY